MNGGIETDILRRKIHQKLLEFTTLPEFKLKNILHNLDKYIDFKPIQLNLKDERKFSKRLYKLLLSAMVEHIKSDGDAMEFLQSKGFDTAEDWLEFWKVTNVKFGVDDEK
ncbi:MAG: hypothetical protein J7L15_03060 [Clostridiales bacterium]|nr:hypothetical protein [Clostridiales bacterium]